MASTRNQGVIFMKKTIWSLLRQLAHTTMQELDSNLHGSERMIGTSMHAYYDMRRRLLESDDILYFLHQIQNSQYDTDTGNKTKMFRIWEDVQDRVITDYENKIREDERRHMSTNALKKAKPERLVAAIYAAVSAFWRVLER